MYLYTERGSKNRNGGFYQLDMPNKTVSIYKNVSVGEHCLVTLLNLYLSKLPQSAVDRDVFYCRSLVKFSEEGPWYSEQPRGVNYLNEMVKTMFSKGNTEGKFTNHSLRLQEQTELFQKEVPEKVIQEITGHQSLKALRQYEKASSVQKKAVSNILTGTSSQNFNAEVDRVMNTNVSSASPPVLFTSSYNNSSAITPVPEPIFSSVVNSNGSSTSAIRPLVFSLVIHSNGSGTINFTINFGERSIQSMQPSVSLPAGDELLQGLDIKKRICERYIVKLHVCRHTSLGL